MSNSKRQVQQVLSQGPRTDLSKDFSKASGVALLLCGDENNLEVLFIKRALNPKDNWSGHLAFPGGKRESHDVSLLAACLREVHEEVGVVLSKDDLIGSLDDIQARKRGHQLEFYVQPFVFYRSEKPVLVNAPDEVEKTVWVSLNYLLDEAHKTEYIFEREDLSLALPGIRFPEGEILWGLTYMMIQNLFWKLKNAAKS